MDDPKRKLPPGDTEMTPRKIEESLKRIEGDLYFRSGSISDCLGRIEEMLENVATKEDLATKVDVTKLKSELIAHSNLLFRWTIGLFVSGVGVILAVLKLT